MIWDTLVLIFAFFNHVAGFLGWFAGSIALALAFGNSRRITRMDEEKVRIDERLYALEDDAGIGPGGSWAQRAVDRRKH